MALTAITNAQIFDGEKAVGVRTVVIDGGRIARVGGDAPEGSEIVDGSGATLLPGLIDAHVHPAPGSLALAPYISTGRPTPQPHTDTTPSHTLPA